MLLARLIATSLTAGAMVAAPPLAQAADTNGANEAQTLFEEAKRLAETGRYAEACPKLARSQQLDPAGGTLLHLAACHEGEGKTATAWSEFNQALSWARRDGRADREVYARSRLDILAPKLVRLTIVVPMGTRDVGLVISLDARALDRTEWGTPAPVDPGEHLIEAAAPNRSRWTSQLHVDRRSGDVAVTVPVLVASLPGPPPSSGDARPLPAAVAVTQTATPSPLPDTGGAGRTAGIVLGAAGVLGLGLGIVFDVHAHQLAANRDNAARRGDAAGTASLDRDAHTAQTTAFIVGGAAIAALGAGAAIYLSAPRPKAVALRLVPQLAESRIGVLLEVMR